MHPHSHTHTPTPPHTPTQTHPHSPSLCRNTDSIKSSALICECLLPVVLFSSKRSGSLTSDTDLVNPVDVRCGFISVSFAHYVMVVDGRWVQGFKATQKLCNFNTAPSVERRGLSGTSDQWLWSHCRSWCCIMNLFLQKSCFFKRCSAWTFCSTDAQPLVYRISLTRMLHISMSILKLCNQRDFKNGLTCLLNGHSGSGCIHGMGATCLK